jgi:1,4-alpha-glucan branching enzyme
VLHQGQAIEMARLHQVGLFQAECPGMVLHDYRLRYELEDGQVIETDDPYRFPSLLSDFDRHLLGEGRHYRNYERLGAHRRQCLDREGVCFTVWAPNAYRVSVVGNFNHWDGRQHPMRCHPGIGVWEIFIPDLSLGEPYKFEILTKNGVLLPLRTDPYGFQFEVRPNTAAIVSDISGFAWNDEDWLRQRPQRQRPDAPLYVYEVHLGSWIRNPSEPDRLLNYRDIAVRLVDYVKEMGFTHIQLMPVSEHPFDGSWGYQCLGYFAPTSRHGSPHDFMWFVDHCHQQGIGVLLDWVPAHFPRDAHGLRLFDGTACYEHADPRQGEHPEWGTMIFNFGRNEVANFLIGSALFWLEHYHIDGLRVDAVASMLYLDYGRKEGEWIPNQYGGNHNLVAAEFIKTCNDTIHERFPDVLMMAEESTSWAKVSRPTAEGGLGFTHKWNMGWMNDTLRYMHRDPIYRKHHQNDLTFSLIYAFNENFVLPLSHDEVVHGKGALLDKMPGDTWQRFANLRLLFGYMYSHPGKKLLFMGGEFGQWQEWRYFQSLDWHLLEQPAHQGIKRLVRDLNLLGRAEPALHRQDFHWDGFEWVDFQDHDACVISFLRKSKHDESSVLVVCHFTPAARDEYVVGVPCPGFYEEVLNTDDVVYGGSGIRNLPGIEAKYEPHTVQQRDYSITIRLPPLGVAIFRVPKS